MNSRPLAATLPANTPLPAIKKRGFGGEGFVGFSRGFLTKTTPPRHILKGPGLPKEHQWWVSAPPNQNGALRGCQYAAK
jgi:hypothetical protein